MMRATMRPCRVALKLLCVFTLSVEAWSQQADVSLHVQIQSSSMKEHGHHSPHASADVVAWLVPLQTESPVPALKQTQQYTLTQKNKQFTPHVLVVPTGSSIEFPNMDPFFHNVFSLFNGKRFDLGLYEAHTQRTVQLDREGVSYIFCNIHPEMGAVVIAVSTPYYGTATGDGTLLIRNVPVGSYRLNLWAEDVTKESLAAASRIIDVKTGHDQFDLVLLQGGVDLMKQHTNKFGESYTPVAKDPY